jgi:hypothetical protein
LLNWHVKLKNSVKTEMKNRQLLYVRSSMLSDVKDDTLNEFEYCLSYKARSFEYMGLKLCQIVNLIKLGRIGYSRHNANKFFRFVVETFSYIFKTAKAIQEFRNGQYLLTSPVQISASLLFASIS